MITGLILIFGITLLFLVRNAWVYETRGNILEIISFKDK